ncbi:MAG: methyltransferase domain-containing protein [Thermoguttaceae bacterium]|jgi:phospholipid N-methyltransferase|nr:methyltransferase domain-containing protein [Thermoguttaceae bacterium]
MHDHTLFWREFRENFRTTGAILPSGRRLSRALARFVAEPSQRPRRILEVGPGTGAVTRRIAPAMHADDRLDLVELNPEFVRWLHEQLRTCPLLAPKADRICVMHSRVEDLPRDAGYDLIISGLPLNCFSVAEVETILQTFAELAQPDAVLSFFEYIGIRKLKGAVAGRAERERLRGIEQVLKQLFAGREIRREAVWRNVPPAWVHHVRLS